MNGDLPKGWSTCNVGDVFRSFSGGTPARGTRAYWGGTIPWLSSGDIKTERIQSASEMITTAGLQNSSASLCRPGAVVVVVRSGILKHTLPVAVLDREAAINQDIKCFDSGNDELNAWFALALRASAKDILTLNREGTTVQSVKYETLKEFVLPIPPPAEQRRIVAKLECVLGKIQSSRTRLESIPAILRRFRESVFAAACAGRLTEDWRADNGVSLAEWIECRLKGVLSEPLSNGRSVPDAVDAKRSFPVLRLTCLKHGRIELQERKDGAWTALEANRYLVKRRDFYVSRGNGSLRLVGRGGLVVDEPDEVAFPDTLIRIRVNRKILSPEFLRQIWNAKPIRDQIEQAAHTTAGIWKISQGDIEEFTLPIPSLPEQQEIVHQVEALFKIADRMEARYAEAKKRVDNLTRSVLAKAFRGELVPKETDLAESEGRGFESAEQLLEKVRRERDASRTKPKK